MSNFRKNLQLKDNEIYFIRIASTRSHSFFCDCNYHEKTSKHCLKLYKKYSSGISDVSAEYRSPGISGFS